jgi:nucleotide-binding universal stress UspA family protein
MLDAPMHHEPPLPDAPNLDRVVVCTDGEAQSSGAIRAAMLIADRQGIVPRVLHVIPGGPYAASWSAEGLTVFDSAEIEGARVELAKKIVAHQLRRAHAPTEWPVELARGTKASSIVRAAREHRADLLVMGGGDHRLIDKLVWGETVLDVLREGDTPLLAVPAHRGRQLNTAVAGVDFGDASVRAAMLAAKLVEPGGTLHLVHVEPSLPLRAIEGDGWWRAHQLGVEDSLAMLDRQLRHLASIRIERHVRAGDPAMCLLEFARSVRADLVATGRERHGWLDRVMIGSVATAMVRAGRSAVLVVPTRSVPRTT